MHPATWENCRSEFESEADAGALVDLIVPGTGAAEWELFWSALRSAPFGFRMYRDGEEIPLPDSASWALAEIQVASVMVSIAVHSITVNCHFFGGDLELDVAPREITNEAAYGAVLEVMRHIAHSLQMPMLATPEGAGVKRAFLKVLPDGRAFYLPLSSDSK